MKDIVEWPGGRALIPLGAPSFASLPYAKGGGLFDFSQPKTFRPSDVQTFRPFDV
jgi:hypothetical protein